MSDFDFSPIPLPGGPRPLSAATNHTLATLLVLGSGLGLLLTGCGSSSSTGSTSSTSTNQYETAYKALTWGAAADVSFPSSCTMTLTSTGVPTYHADYYLAPASNEYPTVVAYTPVSKTGMSVVPYTPASISGNSVTVNVCPTKAATTTQTNMGVIGYLISGEALYNPYEGGGGDVPAMSDNVSYSFVSNGTTYTASFIDECNSHPTPLSTGYSWHYHAVPVCVTASLDGSSGPSHLLGFALDGFPIYGGRDIDGNVISTSQLDACNGITSATPEFPKGAYHYVLPLNTTGKQSSLNCYAGTVSSDTMAKASTKKLICSMKTMQAM